MNSPCRRCSSEVQKAEHMAGQNHSADWQRQHDYDEFKV